MKKTHLSVAFIAATLVALNLQAQTAYPAVRADKIGSIEGQSAGRPTGVSLPFKGQPVQGHSGIKRMADGIYWVLTDSGAGSKADDNEFVQREVSDFLKGR